MVLLVLLVWMLTHGDNCVPLLVQPLILCNGLAAVAHCLCVDDVDSAELMVFVACRLIPLDKKPGVRPIRVGDVPQRIIAKAILHVIGNDIQLSAGALQTCAGHDAGCEATIHVTVYEGHF